MGVLSAARAKRVRATPSTPGEVCIRASTPWCCLCALCCSFSPCMCVWCTKVVWVCGMGVVVTSQCAGVARTVGDSVRVVLVCMGGHVGRRSRLRCTPTIDMRKVANGLSVVWGVGGLCGQSVCQGRVE